MGTFAGVDYQKTRNNTNSQRAYCCMYFIDNDRVSADDSVSSLQSAGTIPLFRSFAEIMVSQSGYHFFNAQKIPLPGFQIRSISFHSFHIPFLPFHSIPFHCPFHPSFHSFHSIFLREPMPRVKLALALIIQSPSPMSAANGPTITSSKTVFLKIWSSGTAEKPDRLLISGQPSKFKSIPSSRILPNRDAKVPSTFYEGGFPEPFCPMMAVSAVVQHPD